MSKTYDCIVVGTGGVGSSALYFAAQKGWSCLGLDRFPPGHKRGSSHGQTRIIRQAYFEHPDYVPLVLDAYQHWDNIEQAAGEQLFQRTGLLQVGHPDGQVISGVSRCAREHGLPLQVLDAGGVRQKFPLFNCREENVGLFEEVAGFLFVEKCITTLTQMALNSGAELIDGVTVNGWSESQAEFVVQTSEGDFRARRLVIAAGAWANDLLPDLKLELAVVAKHQHWFRFADNRTFMKGGCPTFFIESNDGYFYGFPNYDGQGNKIAEHSGGKTISNPLEIDRNLDADDLLRVQQFCNDCFDTAKGVHLEHSVCMYTLSPDEHFIVDTLVDDKVAYACGLSGHGFKFSPSIGKALVDLVDGERRSDMEFLRASRF